MLFKFHVFLGQSKSAHEKRLSKKNKNLRKYHKFLKGVMEARRKFTRGKRIKNQLSKSTFNNLSKR